ncbi:hypothetical protein HY091_01525 [Candidatus Kaiserbacteria bacterium]|nr:hypothetical protein [Candidatus Kaiserbacteria bacterium]
MAQILGNWRVFAATAFSAALIFGAYELARGLGSPSLAQASTETALLQAIAAKDSDNDGLPDWEEALYGTDPNNPDSRGLGMTDGDAVAKGLIVPKAIAEVPTAPAPSPSTSGVNYAAFGLTPPTEGTLTDIFAKNFFALYLAAKQGNNGAALPQSQISALAAQAINNLSASISPAPDFKSSADLRTTDSGADALLAYAASAEAILRASSVKLPKSELLYLQDAVTNDDSSAIENITKIAGAYRTIAAGIAALPVPQELAPANLALVNSLARIAGAASDFARVTSDPIAAMIALGQYPQAVTALTRAFQNIGALYAAAGVNPAPGVPGAGFVRFFSALAATPAP